MGSEIPAPIVSFSSCVCHRETADISAVIARVFRLFILPCTSYLVFGVSSYQPLSAEAVETFGPMHNPIATKGHENLFVALANCKRIDGSTLCSSAGCIRCAPKMEYRYLICILAQHSSKKWNEVTSCSPLAGHNGSSSLRLRIFNFAHLTTCNWLSSPVWCVYADL